MSRIISRRATAFALIGALLGFPAVGAQTGQPPPAPSVVRTDDLATVSALLDRIERIVKEARGDVETDDVEPVGTSGRGGATGKIKIEAADLDEIRAELAQIRALLQKAS